jgi:hypothetical protein
MNACLENRTVVVGRLAFKKDCLTIEIIMFLQSDDYVNCSANTVMALTTY